MQSSRQFVSDEAFSGPGGGSRRLTDKTAGPKRGFYVALGNKEGKGPAQGAGAEVKAPVGPGLQSAVSSHFETAKPYLDTIPKRDQDDVYQGKWVPESGEGDEAVLDVSVRKKHFNAAMRMGKRENQEAIWDAKKGKSVYV